MKKSNTPNLNTKKIEKEMDKCLRPVLQATPSVYYIITDFTQYDDMDFITNLYRGILLREPDEKGVQLYLSRLRSGELSKIEILTALRFSKEGKNKNIKIIGINKHLLIATLYRLPVIGYVAKTIITLLTLPKLLKQLNYLENSVGQTSLKNKTYKTEIETLKSTKADNKEIETLFLNMPINSKQFLLDISMLVQADEKSGIQRVARAILLELLKCPPEGYTAKPIYYDGKRYRYANNFIVALQNKPKEKIDDRVVNFRQNDIYLALDITSHLIYETHDFYAYLQDMGIKVYFIIYDILITNNKEWWSNAVSINFNEWLTSITEVSTGLICISEAVADEVQEWMDQNPPKRLFPPRVMSFHLGADIENSAPSEGVPKNSESVLNQLRSRSSFLMVGTIEPRKGHRQTVEAFEKLWQKGTDINLIIVGKVGWLVDELIKKLNGHPERNKHLFWLEGISDEYLEKVYTASTCLIAASEGEGFGLPLIEAAQHKLPIIARDLPVFHEVAGKYAYYFNNDRDPEVLADAIESWLDLFEKGRYPKSVEMPYLTWKESTRQLLQLIAEEAEY